MFKIQVLIVDKKNLIESIRSFRPSEIKITDKLTKQQLIRAIFEDSSSTRDFMETSSEDEEGMGSITREDVDKETKDIKANITVEVPKPTPEQPVTENPVEPIPEESKEEPKEKVSEEKEVTNKPKRTGLRFATDLGFKAVAMNDEFIQMDETKQTALSGMFKPDELKKIASTPLQQWTSLEAKPFYCNEEFIKLNGGEPSTRIPCWRNDNIDKVVYANLVNKGYINSYYTRLDEGGKVKKYTRENGTILVPMGPRSADLEFYGLELDGTRYAIAYNIYANDETFVAPSNEKKVDFFFDKSGKKSKPKPVTKPKKPATSKPVSGDTDTKPSNEQKAGDLLLGLGPQND